MNADTKLKILMLVAILVLICVILAWVALVRWIGEQYGTLAGGAAVILPIFAVFLGAILLWHSSEDDR